MTDCLDATMFVISVQITTRVLEIVQKEHTEIIARAILEVLQERDKN